jgi:Bacterial Ig-like domain (group 1)
MNRAAMPTKTLSLWIGIILFALLQGCGGGGTRGNTLGGNGETPTQAGVENADSVQLLVSSPTIESSGLLTVEVTAVVLDAKRRAVPGKLVDLGISDPNNTAFLTGLSNNAKTDDTGILKARLNLGTNHANRAIALTAAADKATSSNTVNVVGTVVTLTGATSLVGGATTQMTVSVKDSTGNPLSSAAVTVTSALGNTFTPASGLTNANGQLIVTVKGVNAGNDTISASTLGASASAPLNISGSDFAFIAPSPAPDADVVLNTTQTLRVRWFEQGVAQNGKVLSFNATRGTVTPGTVTIGPTGEATVTISAKSAGPSTVTASAPTGTPSTATTFVFVTTSASVINVQADRTTLSVNAIDADSSRSTIRAVVRDADNNLVKNARVEFRLLQDPTAGRLATSSDVTDVSGIATADYVAGTISSNQNGVQIAARVVDVGGVPVAGTIEAFVNLTVAGQSLFIRLGTDNKVLPGDTKYTKRYSALVTDAAGNPKPGVSVQFEVNPAQPPARAYRKGYYARVRGIGQVGTAGIWVPQIMAECFNEDVNLDGILERGFVSEDTNYNGVLDPGEDVNGNGVIDLRPVSIPAVAIGGTGTFASAEPGDLNKNGIFTDVINEVDPNGNGISDPGEPADLNGDGDTTDLIREDPNGNGVFDPAEQLHRSNLSSANAIADTSEDFNANGSLTPGNVAGATNNVVTDSSGFAITDIAYAPEFATWTTVTLQAKVIVAGTESVSRVTFELPALAADLNNLDVAPPGVRSPFGLRRNCADQF